MRRAVEPAVVSALVSALLSGCPSGATGGRDAASTDGGADDGAVTGGLRLAFEAVPPLPATSEGLYPATVDAARLVLRDVRAIGDAAPGDPRTTRAEVTLELDPEASADPVVFEDAPPGRYSRVEGRVKRLRVTGAVDVDELTPFVIDDEPPRPVTFSFPLAGVELPAGGERTVTIGVELIELVEPIDWTAAPLTPEGYRIDGDSDAILPVREELGSIFAQWDGASR